MSNKNLSVALMLTANASGLDAGLRHGQSSVKQFTSGVKREFDALGSAWRSTMGKVGLIGGGVGVGLMLKQATSTFGQAEHDLRAMGNAGDLSSRQLSTVQRELLGTAQKTNQFRQELIGGLNVLVSSGMEFERARTLIEDVGYAATASGASIEDLSKTAFALDTNLKVLPSDMRKALNILTVSGFSGAFELKDMARYFPVITAQIGKLKMEGPKAAASIGAALQVAKMGAGTQEEAATNLQNYLMKLTMKDTTKNFEKEFNVDWEKEFKKFLKTEDPLLASAQFIAKKVGTDPFNIQKVFGDQQVLNFLNPMLKFMDKYKEFRDKSVNDKVTINRAYQANMDTGVEQWKRMNINMQAVVQSSETLNSIWSKGNELLKATNDRLSDKSVTLETLVGGGAALAAGTYIGGRIFKGVTGKMFASLGGTAAGVAVGKGLQEAAGVTPVFVVNMPAAGMGGGSVIDKLPGAGGAGGGTAASLRLWPALVRASIPLLASAGYVYALHEYTKGADRKGTYLHNPTQFTPNPNSWRITNWWHSVNAEDAHMREQAWMAKNFSGWQRFKESSAFGDATPLPGSEAEALRRGGGKGSSADLYRLHEQSGDPARALQPVIERFVGAFEGRQFDLSSGLGELAASQERSGKALETRLGELGGDLQTAINNSNMADKIGRYFDAGIARINEKKATLTVKIDGPGRVTAAQASGFNLNVDTGLLPVGQ